MGSFYSYSYNYEAGEFLYDKKVDEIFNLFKRMQDPQNPQQRIDNGPDIPRNIAFNLSNLDHPIPDYMKEFFDKNKRKENTRKAG